MREHFVDLRVLVELVFPEKPDQLPSGLRALLGVRKVGCRRLDETPTDAVDDPVEFALAGTDFDADQADRTAGLAIAAAVVSIPLGTLSLPFATPLYAG